MKLPPLTQNQKLVLTALLGIAVSALSTAGTAVMQSYTKTGLDIPVLFNVASWTFMPVLGAGLFNYIPGHALQVMQALQDTTRQQQSNNAGLQQAHAVLTQTVQTLSQVVQKQAVQAAQPPAPPLQGSVQPVNTNVAQQPTAINWMLDVPPNTTTNIQPPLQGASVVQVPFPPARPVGPQSMPAVKPVDVSQQDTQYQSVTLPPDLHFGDSTVMPAVGQP